MAMVGVLALIAPGRASTFFRGFAATATRHYIELALRAVAGWALVVSAPRLSPSTVFAAAGWLLLGTTGVMLAIPWRKHEAFAQRTVPRAMKLLPAIGVVSFAAGGAILWSAYASSAA